MGEIRELQKSDPSLEGTRRLAKVNQYKFFFRDGLLYRRWTPRIKNGEEFGVDQLVLPREFRPVVMKLSHCIPFAGHLGRNKTTSRMLQRFYWPTLFRDIKHICSCCEKCQRCSTKRPPKAPLIPLPVIAESFRRIAMDIVGPLPRSRSGNRYILVICDYSTRYPEAVPLCNITAETIAEELMKLFARVGIPEEILTDQGSNFTSEVLKELYRCLHIRAIRTSPYHPQTDGLVERFNGTLKNMIKKFVTEKDKDWDKLLPYLLFGYREVPHASTGFSSFELLYGRAVSGPLNILKEAWEGSKKSSDSVVSYFTNQGDDG